MEKLKLTKEKLIKIQDVIIFILLVLWMLMPVMQSLKISYEKWNITTRYFDLMTRIGIVGIALAIINIYFKIKNAENKKDVIKQLAPIFLFVLYMIWTLISAKQAAIKRQAFYGNTYRKEGYYMYINYAGFFLCSFLLKSKKLRKALLNIFLMSTLFLIAAGRIGLVNKELLKYFARINIYNSVFQQFNHYGYYLLMSLVCSFGLFVTEKNKIMKIIYLLIYAIITYAFIYNNTFGCYLAIAVFFVLYGIYAFIKKADRTALGIVVLIFVILSCVTTRKGVNLASKSINEFANDIKSIISKISNEENDKPNSTEIQKEEQSKENQSESKTQTETQKQEISKEEQIEDNFENAGTGRMKLWKYALKLIRKKPIIGYGPDNLRGEYLKNGIDQDRPHNLFLHLATVSGIPGMIIYITAVGIIVVKGIKRLFSNNKEGIIYLAIVITYLISSMFGNSMYYTSPYFFIFLGSLMHYNLKKEE